jgi:molecular chaperone DnaK
MDQVVYAAEKALKEHGDKVSQDIKKNVQEKIDRAKSVRSGSDVAAIKSAAEALSTAMQAIGQAMSQNQQTPPPSDQKPPEEPPKQ